MTNKEHYKEQILDIACKGYPIGVNKTSGNPSSCGGSLWCAECLFRYKEDYHGSGNCTRFVQEWANAEYVEKPKLTKNEKLFLSLLSEKWKYMTRDQNGALMAHVIKPIKYIGSYMWCTEFVPEINISIITNCYFPMVKWEDKEPWLIEDLKKLPVKEEEN